MVQQILPQVTLHLYFKTMYHSTRFCTSLNDKSKQNHKCRPKTTWQRTVETDMKNMNQAGAPSRGWPVTDRGGGASLLPCTLAGGTGSDDDDENHKQGYPKHWVGGKNEEMGLCVLLLYSIAESCPSRKMWRLTPLLLKTLPIPSGTLFTAWPTFLEALRMGFTRVSICTNPNISPGKDAITNGHCKTLWQVTITALFHWHLLLSFILNTHSALSQNPESDFRKVHL